MGPAPVHLVRGRERSAEVEAFAAQHGGRVGLEGVLADLNRTALPAFDTGSAATWGFRWDREDDDSKRWWPQGITSSADAGPTEEYAGRRLLVTTSYSKTVDGVNKGCRISVVDLTEEHAIRYRHVLLAVVGLDDNGGPAARPLNAHAGGIVWRGPHLHVAATTRGFHTFHVDDVVKVPADTGLGHRYVLPLRATWGPRIPEGGRPFAHSFLSLGRSSGRGSEGDTLLVGEYGRGRMTQRLVTYDLDAAGQPVTGDGGVASPAVLPDGPARMQGAVSVDGRLHVVTSNGRWRRGSLWVGPPGELRQSSRVLPPGPEDITYWPSREELWVTTEYPGRRFVLALDRKRFD